MDWLDWVLSIVSGALPVTRDRRMKLFAKIPSVL